MDDPIDQCGNDLRFLEWLLLHHFKKDIGDPAEREKLMQLAALTQSLVQVVVSSSITNRGLSQEFRAESAKALVGAAARFANVQQAVAA